MGRWERSVLRCRRYAATTANTANTANTATTPTIPVTLSLPLLLLGLLGVIWGKIDTQRPTTDRIIVEIAHSRSGRVAVCGGRVGE